MGIVLHHTIVQFCFRRAKTHNHHQTKFFILSCTKVGACLCSFLLFKGSFRLVWNIPCISNPKGVIINFYLDQSLDIYPFLGIFHLEPKMTFVKTLLLCR
jgi:hypothetical protein